MPSLRNDSTSRVARLVRHRIVRNAFALYWVQFATLIVPLVTLPYLTRVLGQDALGTLILAQSSSNVLGLVLEFGFNQSATRDVAVARDDRNRLSSIVSGVLGAKAILAAATLAAVLVAAGAISSVGDQPEFVVLAWLAAVGMGFTPNWFFLGIEAMRVAALVQLASRVLATVLTFLLVHEPEDAWIVLALTAASTGFAAVVLIARMSRRAPVRVPRWAESAKALRRGSRLFVSAAAVGFYTTANVVILGLFVPAAQVAVFGLAERIVRAATQLLAAVASAAYPRLSYLQRADAAGRARRLGRVTLASLVAVGVASAVFLAVFDEEIVRVLFGSEFAASAPLLQILCLIVPLIAYSTVIAGWMLSLEMDRQLVRTVLLGAAVNLVLAFVAAPAFGARGMAWAVVLAELAVALGLTAAVLKRDSTTSGVGFFRRSPGAGPTSS